MSAFCCLKPSTNNDGPSKSSKKKDPKRSEMDLLNQQRSTLDSPLLGGSTNGLSFSDMHVDSSQKSLLLDPNGKRQLRQVSVYKVFIPKLYSS